MADRPNGVQPGRHRADFPEGTVVFLIGMRINSLWRIRLWLPVFMAMPRMLRELFDRPELGLLHAHNEFSLRRATVIQYWESMDRLMTYAASREHEHLPAWQAYNRMVRRSGATVGVWHEAYVVNPATSHLIYQHMPSFGMGKATRYAPVSELPPQPVTSRLET